MHPPRLRRLLIVSAKVVLATALLAYLVVQAQQHDSFTRLVEQPKRWSLLAAAAGLMVAVAVVTFVRWFLLVRALELAFSLGDAMRLGSLGYVLNLVSLGTVGGDLFKAILIAKDQPGRRTEAVATVVADRVIGLYALLLVAAGAVLVSDVRSRGPAIAAFSDAIVVCAALATLALVLLMFSAFTSSQFETRLLRVGFMGHTAARLLAAVRVYRSRPRVLLVAVLMSAAVHIGIIVVMLCVAHGLPGAVPQWSDHFVLVPLSNVAGALPLTPSGLGTFELAMESLYQLMGQGQNVVQGTGTIVAFGYRLTNILVAGVAATYYLAVSGRLPTLEAAAHAESRQEESAAVRNL